MHAKYKNFIRNCNISVNFIELPDLVPDEQEMERSAYLEDKQLLYLQCAMEENCLASEVYKMDKNDYGNTNCVVIITFVNHKSK